MTQSTPNGDNSEKSTKKIAKITLTLKKSWKQTNIKAAKQPEALVEKSLIEATRLLLREFGIRKSGAAIRDAVEIPHSEVGPREAVSALTNFGFKASFGSMKIKI